MRKVDRHPLVPPNKATRGRVHGEHWSVGASSRVVWGFGKLGGGNEDIREAVPVPASAQD